MEIDEKCKFGNSMYNSRVLGFRRISPLSRSALDPTRWGDWARKETQRMPLFKRGRKQDEEDLQWLYRNLQELDEDEPSREEEIGRAHV